MLLFFLSTAGSVQNFTTIDYLPFSHCELSGKCINPITLLKWMNFRHRLVWRNEALKMICCDNPLPFPLFCNLSKRIFSRVGLSFWNFLRMETNVYGLNEAKFLVKTHFQSIICILPLPKMEFLVAYWGNHYSMDSSVTWPF